MFFTCGKVSTTHLLNYFNTERIGGDLKIDKGELEMIHQLFFLSLSVFFSFSFLFFFFFFFWFLGKSP